MKSRMEKSFKKLVERVGLRFLRSVYRRLDEQVEMLRLLARANAQTRAMVKRQTGGQLNVVFVCHSPSLWGKLSPVFRELHGDPRFNVVLVAVPYRHNSFGNQDYHDDGIAEYLRVEEGVDPIVGFNKATGEWLDLQNLAPDYVFFQTPYDSLFPRSLTSECVSLYSRICYVPYYGILIFKGAVEEITHPVRFFRNVSLVLVGHEMEAQELLERFRGTLEADQVKMVGAPMLDYVRQSKSPEGSKWNLEQSNERTRILWTPRWRTEEGNCHFFDYKNYFMKLAQDDAQVDFLFRPHPLCLKNFLASEELSQDDCDSMLAEFKRLPNAAIDESGDYQDTFMSCDILVSDMSSMMAEYFITGKPIVYTHRVDTFNDFGSELAEGYYWVRSETELGEVLSMLRRGEDPLKVKRQEIIERMFYIPTEGSACVIKNTLKECF
jgi:hypothetical protein